VGATASLPILANGTQLVQYGDPVTGSNPNKTILIDILRDPTTGNLYVDARGTANLQNVVTDLTLSNNPDALAAVTNASNIITGYLQLNPQAKITFAAAQFNLSVDFNQNA
jgi:hypothetical protein